MRHNSMSMGECLGTKQAQPSLLKVVQSKGWLSVMQCGKGMSLRTIAKIAGLFHYFGQDGFRARVPQHPIET